MIVSHTFAEARSGREGAVGLVPTMGMLHEGHLSLIERSVSENQHTVVSLFVNPLQFNEKGDLDRYPRDFDRDSGLAAGAGADVLFAPATDEMYPTTPVTRVNVSGMTDHMEGAHRPGHFAGVATVVAKLFAGLQPDVAYFGRKDAQQLAVVTAMAEDLSFPVKIRPGSTIREADGLALSSRNVFLEPSDRLRAVNISRGLFAAADLVEQGDIRAQNLIDACRNEMSGLEVEYVELADQRTARPVGSASSPVFLAVAARVGQLRLIDNLAIDIIDGTVRPDRGVMLSEPSMLYYASR